MSSFTIGIWARRKNIVIFLIGILLPSLSVGYLSWSALSKRSEALKQTIESQLWISGETAINSIEGALREYEDRVLSPENFLQISPRLQGSSGFKKPAALWQVKSFLLDADYQIMYPRSEAEYSFYSEWESSHYDSPFVSFFQRAEYLEFVENNYRDAAEIYRRCFSSTPRKELRAFALEGMGRSMFQSADYQNALQIYSELMDTYGRERNRVGHPYGLLAPLRLYEISLKTKSQEPPLDSLIELLESLMNGDWMIESTVFEFFSEKITSILEYELSEGKDPELYKYYLEIKGRPSPYLKEREFKTLLEENVIPWLKERVVVSRFSNMPMKGRLPLDLDDSYGLVSYSRLRDINSDQIFYAGFLWDLDYLKNYRLPEIAEMIAQDTGIQIRILESDNSDESSSDQKLLPADALSVTFRQFPLPWRFIVTQSALENLKTATKRDNVLHGILLFIILGLMGLGTYLISRDISRETEIARQKTEFLHNISHELKTPLTLIRLFGETLRDKPSLSRDTKKEAYEIITRESERLSHMINNVLDFSRIEMGRKEFELREADLAVVISKTLESYSYHLKNKGFVINSEIDPDIPCVEFDREAIASMLINLLSNAMKFSQDNKVVDVRLFREQNRVILQVADRGIGISRNELDNIFTRFYRSKNDRVSDTSGSGLGLTIVQHIAEAHGGGIDVKSEVGQGSEFSVYFPCPEKKG